MMATGTIQSSSDPSVKPWSSNGLRSAGINGSVAAATIVANTAMVHASRW